MAYLPKAKYALTWKIALCVAIVFLPHSGYRYINLNSRGKGVFIKKIPTLGITFRVCEGSPAIISERIGEMAASAAARVAGKLKEYSGAGR